jgi:hypothetical protein
MDPQYFELLDPGVAGFSLFKASPVAWDSVIET